MLIKVSRRGGENCTREEPCIGNRGNDRCRRGSPCMAYVMSARITTEMRVKSVQLSTYKGYRDEKFVLRTDKKGSRSCGGVGPLITRIIREEWPRTRLYLSPAIQRDGRGDDR